MAGQERQVSFVPQGVKWREPGEDGDGLLVLARPQKSVFTRLGPKFCAAVCDPPYVPESVGEPPLAGMIFGCSPETYEECISRQLFGLPAWQNKPQVMRIAPGAAIFLFDFKTKCMHGIFEATSHGGVHIVREAFGGKYEAQVKVQLAENCPPLHEKDFKDAIRENYRDAKKFNFPLSESQVSRLKLRFRLKAAEDSALSIDLNHGRRVVQFCPGGPQQARSSIQVQRRVISNVSKDEVEVSRTLLISAPPVLSRVHVSPSSHTRSRSLGGLEVSICSKEKKDKKHNGVSDSPRRHVVMYDTRKEQSITPVLKSKIPRPARQEVVREVFQSQPSTGFSQDRKRRAETSPHGVQEHNEQLLLLEQGQEIDEGGSGKHYGDLRELLNLKPKVKRLRPSIKEKIKSSVSQPVDPPAYTGGNIAIGDVLFIDDSKRNLERILPLPRKKHLTITSGSLIAESSKDVVISRTSKKADSTEDARRNGNTTRPVQNVRRKLKAASVSADDIGQLRTTAGSHGAMANDVEGRGLIEIRRSENGYNNADKELKAANDDGLGGCVDLSTNLPIQSGVPQRLDDKIIESGPGDQPKDGRLDIYVSLTVDKAENARQSTSLTVSENHVVGHVVSCLLGKRTRGSKQDDTVSDSAMEPQSLHTGISAKQLMEVSKGSHPEDSTSEVLLTDAIVSETLQQREQGNYLPAVALAEDQNFTSQVRARNASSCMENLSEEGMRYDHVQSRPTNILSLIDVVPVVSTVIPNNAGDMMSLDCKRHRAEKENVPLSSVHKVDKIGHNEAGCSYVTPEASTSTEASALRERVLHKYEMGSQSSSHSLFSGKLGNPWNSRTLRYGKPRISDTLANHGARISSKSGSEPTSALGKSDPNAGGIKLGEESVYSGGENYDRQPGSPNATEASRTSGRLEKQGVLLVCELGNPGGLSLDSNMIGVDTEGDILRKHQPSAVTSVVQQPMLPSQIDSPCRPDVIQTINTALVTRSDELESSEFRKKFLNMKGLTERESEAADKICHADDVPSLESVQPTIAASNEGTAYLNLLLRKEPMPLKMEPIPLKLELMPLKTELMPHRADALEDTRDLVVEDWLYARNRGSPSACTSTASLSDCSGPVGEPELEISIPIKEEELEICLPIEEDEEVNAGLKSQTQRLSGSSNTDIKPWKFLQKTPLHNT